MVREAARPVDVIPLFEGEDILGVREGGGEDFHLGRLDLSACAIEFQILRPSDETAPAITMYFLYSGGMMVATSPS